MNWMYDYNINALDLIVLDLFFSPYRVVLAGRYLSSPGQRGLYSAFPPWQACS